MCTALPRLSVRHVDLSAAPRSARRHIIADEAGREVTLRGVNFFLPSLTTLPQQVPIAPGAYAGGACPPNRVFYPSPPLCEVDAGRGRYGTNTSALSQNDVSQARLAGFNSIRLAVTWESLEPVPGVYDATYLSRLSQIVSWADEQGLYVFLDMHEDLFSRHVAPRKGTIGLPPLLTPSSGQDGAPRWATITGGWPSLAPFGIGQANPAMLVAFQGLWSNKVIPGIPQGAAPGPGLQDHFIGALAALARTFANCTTVAGLELMNEPQQGTTLDWTIASRDFLYPFYSRVAQAITGVRDGLPTCTSGRTDGRVGRDCAYPDLGITYTGLLLAEPLATRNLLDYSTMKAVQWTSYPNVVHAVHVYTHIFSIDRSAPLLARLLLPSPWPPSFTYAYETAWQEANSMHAAVLVTEYGCSPRLDEDLVLPTSDAQDETGTGAFLWQWKANCAWSWPQGAEKCQAESWSVYAPAQGPSASTLPPNGPLLASRTRLISRIHSRAVLGEAISYLHNSTTGVFYLIANLTRHTLREVGERARAAELARAAEVASLPSASREWAEATVLATVDGAPPESACTPSLFTLLRAGGSVGEVYLPPWTAGSMVIVWGGAALRNVVTWPDASRTAYVVAHESPRPYAFLSYGGASYEGCERAAREATAAGLPWPPPTGEAGAQETRTLLVVPQ